LQDPRFHSGAIEGKQIAKGEKVPGLVRVVEKPAKVDRAGEYAKSCNHGRAEMPCGMAVCRPFNFRIFAGAVLISERGSATLAIRHGTHSAETIGRIIMQWTAPVFEEVCLNCEINSYASAKL
jgi:coenzyme PQQ precursor peptide PqqA